MSVSERAYYLWEDDQKMGLPTLTREEYWSIASKIDSTVRNYRFYTDFAEGASAKNQYEECSICMVHTAKLRCVECCQKMCGRCLIGLTEKTCPFCRVVVEEPMFLNSDELSSFRQISALHQTASAAPDRGFTGPAWQAHEESRHFSSALRLRHLQRRLENESSHVPKNTTSSEAADLAKVRAYEKKLVLEFLMGRPVFHDSVNQQERARGLRAGSLSPDDSDSEDDEEDNMTWFRSTFRRDHLSADKFENVD